MTTINCSIQKCIVCIPQIHIDIFDTVVQLDIDIPALLEQFSPVPFEQLIPACKIFKVTKTER